MKGFKEQKIIVFNTLRLLLLKKIWSMVQFINHYHCTVRTFRQMLCYFSGKPTKYTDLFVCHLILDGKNNAYSLECKNGCSKENRKFCNTEIHQIILSFEANGNSICFIFMYNILLYWFEFNVIILFCLKLIEQVHNKYITFQRQAQKRFQEEGWQRCNRRLFLK